MSDEQLTSQGDSAEETDILSPQDEYVQSPEFSYVDEDEPDGSDVVLPHDAFVTTSDWTAETIVTQLAKGNIDVNPGFQRRDAWDTKRKRLFIESLFLGIPVPQLVLAEKERGQYIALDGKQRLLTLLNFSESYGKYFDKPLRLSSLPYLKSLNGKTWAKIQSDPELQMQVRAFENAPIRTVLIRNWKTEEFLHVIFNRLNTGSLPLSSQELRAALNPGSYTKFLEESSAGNGSLRTLLKLKKPDFRMRDAEIQLRATGFDLLISEYSGSLRDFLNKSQKIFNATWATNQQAIEASTTSLEQALAGINEVFGPNAGRRFTKEGYERTINRAVLDALIFSFRNAAFREAAQKHPEQVRSAFEEVCLDPDFAASVQLTTKTPAAIQHRISTLSLKFSHLFGVAVPTVELVDNRLVKK